MDSIARDSTAALMFGAVLKGSQNRAAVGSVISDSDADASPRKCKGCMHATSMAV